MQREEHAELRSGLLTASVAKTVVSGTHAGKNSLLQKIWDAELHARSFRSGGTKAIQHGQDMESLAIAIFWEETGYDQLDETFYTIQDASSVYYGWVGASPDSAFHSPEGLVTLEVKCPYKRARYDGYIQEMEPSKKNQPGRCPKEHFWQVQWQLWVSEAHHAYFMTYWSSTEYAWIRVERDPGAIDKIKAAAKEFIDHLCSGQLFEPPTTEQVLEAL